MWKGVLTYTFQTLSNPPQYQSLDCAQRKLGAPIRKNSTYKPSPIHTLSKDTKGSASEYNIWAYFGYNQRVSSSVFQTSPIIIVVGYVIWRIKDATIELAARLSLIGYSTFTLLKLKLSVRFWVFQKFNELGSVFEIYSKTSKTSPALMSYWARCLSASPGWLFVREVSRGSPGSRRGRTRSCWGQVCRRPWRRPAGSGQTGQWCTGRRQVWSLAQFYFVDFSKSRIGVKKVCF